MLSGKQYSLLLDCFMALLSCVRKAEGASNSIYDPLMVHTILFPSKLTLKLHTKYQILGKYPISAGNGVQGTVRRYSHC